MYYYSRENIGNRDSEWSIYLFLSSPTPASKRSTNYMHRTCQALAYVYVCIKEQISQVLIIIVKPLSTLINWVPRLHYSVFLFLFCFLNYVLLFMKRPTLLQSIYSSSSIVTWLSCWERETVLNIKRIRYFSWQATPLDLWLPIRTHF